MMEEMNDMEMGSKKKILQALIEKMHELIAGGKYEADEEMEKDDMSDAMQQAKDEVVPDSEDDSYEDDMEEGEDNGLQDEIRDFMKGNKGKQPDASAMMVKVKARKPMGKAMRPAASYMKKNKKKR